MNLLARSKLFLIAIAILISVGGTGWILWKQLYPVFRDNNFNHSIASKVLQVSSIPTPLSKTDPAHAAEIAEAAVIPEEWETYKNDKFGYSIKYPKHWTLIEATKQISPDTRYVSKEYLQIGEIQKVSFEENPTDLSRYLPFALGKIEVGVLKNTNSQTLEQWTKGMRIVISGGGEIPAQKIEDIQLGGLPAKEVHQTTLAVDDPGITIITAQRGYLYFISFADYSQINYSNKMQTTPDVSDVMRERNRQIYIQMISSFTFLR